MNKKQADLLCQVVAGMSPPKPARKRRLKFDDFKARVRSIWSCAAHFHQTHDEILAERQSLIYDEHGYKFLTRYQLGYLDGVWYTLYDRHYQTLVWTHEIDGVRVLGGPDHSCDYDLSKINLEKSWHAYQLPDGSFKRF